MEFAHSSRPYELRVSLTHHIPQTTSFHQKEMCKPDEEKTESGNAISQVRELLDESHHREICDEEIQAFLEIHRQDVFAAAKAVAAAAVWKRDNPVSILDVSAFYRAPPGAKHPPGCGVLLENPKTGDCARDLEGNPIVVVIGGFFHGNAHEINQQMHYVLQRASVYSKSCKVLGIIEVQPRTKQDTSCFRFPEAASRSGFDVAKRFYPGSQTGAIHFCGLPRIVTAGFAVCSSFLDLSKLQLKPNFSHLSKYISKENMLKEWGGTLEFDLNEYVEWRAREENVPLKKLCPRGLGRPYHATDNIITASALLEHNEVIFQGTVQKQGSGIGFLSSRKWKMKLLVAVPKSLYYFDSTQVNEKNKATRMIALDDLSTVELLNDSANTFRVHSEGRNFDFQAETADLATQWKESIEKAIGRM